jgi:pSer/pThr/pTyr-binding forkhead associated (FHA) protein/Mg-chelatase subunit ChlD
MKKYLILTLLTLAFIHFMSQGAYSKKDKFPPLDMVFVVDNSGSMVKGDPEFMSRSLVSKFLEGLSGDDRVSFVIFDESFRLAMPLTPVAEKATGRKISEAMSKVDYNGQYTNVPAAIERAICELRDNGRKKAEKLIILLSDGIIDTGDRARDVQKRHWLRDDLSLESKKAGVRVFGIAFTDQADTELVQALGQMTHGGYYQVHKAGDVQKTLSRINETILKPKSETAMEAATERGFPMGLLLILAVVGIAVLGIFAARVLLVQSTASQESVPGAYLLDINAITDKGIYRISKRSVTIGRSNADGTDMSIGIDTISAKHAQIEYRDHSFYLTDLGSKNGTYLNEGKDRITDEVRLKNGDVIILDQHKFRFMVPGYEDKWVAPKPVQSRGETVLSVPEPPEQLSPEDSQPADPRNQEEEDIELKPFMCPEHPNSKATETCAVCQRTLCTDCIVEKDGKRLCKRCMEMQFAFEPR